MAFETLYNLALAYLYTSFLVLLSWPFKSHTMSHSTNMPHSRLLVLILIITSYNSIPSFFLNINLKVSHILSPPVSLPWPFKDWITHSSPGSLHLQLPNLSLPIVTIIPLHWNDLADVLCLVQYCASSLLKMLNKYLLSEWGEWNKRQAKTYAEHHTYSMSHPSCNDIQTLFS